MNKNLDFKSEFIRRAYFGARITDLHLQSGMFTVMLESANEQRIALTFVAQLQVNNDGHNITASAILVAGTPGVEVPDAPPAP